MSLVLEGHLKVRRRGGHYDDSSRQASRKITIYGNYRFGKAGKSRAKNYMTTFVDSPF